MELVHYHHGSGTTETLRPTHAIKVAALLGPALIADGESFTIRAGTLADSARRVRDEYRCRTVRKELRRIGLLGVEGVADGRDIEIRCGDPEVMRQMAEAASGA
jgi:hypothetical protein